jgi:hypothetical protein
MTSGLPDGAETVFPGWVTGMYGIGVGEVADCAGTTAFTGVVYTGTEGRVVGEVAGATVGCVVVTVGATLVGAVVAGDVAGIFLTGVAAVFVVVTGATGAKAEAACS